jgi:hypothetical protein
MELEDSHSVQVAVRQSQESSLGNMWGSARRRLLNSVKRDYRY